MTQRGSCELERGEPQGALAAEYTRYLYLQRRIKLLQTLAIGLLSRASIPNRSGLRGITGTGEDGETRVLGKAWIGLGKLAEKELRSFAGID
jgi:hypothetical protein